MSVDRTVRNLISFGGRLPAVVGALVVLTIVVTVASAPGLGLSPSLLLWGRLVPGDVLHGQVWRLLTWSLFASSPFALLFDGLMFYWCGRDLYYAWGARRFLAVFLGGSAAAGLVVTGAARLLYGEPGTGVPFSGAEGMSSALVIWWALSFPERLINLFLVLPIRGGRLAAAVVGVTVLYGAFYGVLVTLPEFAAEAVALAFMYRFRVLRPLRALFRRRTPRKRSTRFRVWDDEKQQFRPPKWMN